MEVFGAMIFVVVLFVVIIVSNAIRILREYERGIVFRLGRLIKIPTAPMLALLGLGRTDDNATAGSPAQTSTAEPARARHAG